jgi:hypothetical protein
LGESTLGWWDTLDVHNSILIVFNFFNCSYFQFICVNDGMGLKSIMNSYIKTQCKIFMTKFLVCKLLWTFKVVQKLYLIKKMNIYSIYCPWMNKGLNDNMVWWHWYSKTNLNKYWWIFFEMYIKLLFLKINSLDVHLSNIKWQWVKLEIFNSLWQTSHDVLPHG